MNGATHDVYVTPAPATVALVVSRNGWPAAQERWHWLSRVELASLANEGGRVARSGKNPRPPRGSDKPIATYVDRHWDHLQDAWCLPVRGAAELAGIATRDLEEAITERMH